MVDPSYESAASISPVTGTVVWLVRDDHGEEATPVFLRTFGLTEGDVIWRAGTDNKADQP
jgi:hypothetical protein